MTALNRDEVQRIAHLARLTIDESAIPKYVRDLSNILQLADQMGRIETGNITPMAHPLDVSQRVRTDQVTETDQRELFQSVAPAVAAGLYLVPKVIEE